MRLIQLFIFTIGIAAIALGQTGRQSLQNRMIGCFSAGDSGLTILRITKAFVQTSNGKQKIPYKVVSSNAETNVLLLELLQKDRSNSLQKFVAVSQESPFDLVLQTYQSLSDYDARRNGGRLGFARDRCSTIMKLLR
jgi:hypothetical protein